MSGCVRKDACLSRAGAWQQVLLGTSRYEDPELHSPTNRYRQPDFTLADTPAVADTCRYFLRPRVAGIRFARDGPGGPTRQEQNAEATRDTRPAPRRPRAMRWRTLAINPSPYQGCRGHGSRFGCRGARADRRGDLRQSSGRPVRLLETEAATIRRWAAADLEDQLGPRARADERRGRANRRRVGGIEPHGNRRMLKATVIGYGRRWRCAQGRPTVRDS